MSDSGVGRLLVASLHQGIADLLPARLEFYESWLNPSGLRDGRIGVAPLTAVLSFLRQEGDLYRDVACRAGEYTAEWTMADLPGLQRTMIRVAPGQMRLRLVFRVVRRMVQATFHDSRVDVQMKDDGGVIDIRGSIFCDVRERSNVPLCHFYASAIRRLLLLLDLEADVGLERCRAVGGGQCVMAVAVRRAGAR